MRHSDLVLLGLLGDGPRHGYELTQEIEDMRVRTWARISPATVYRGLRRLEEQGRLEAETEREGRRPERTVYRLSSAGEDHLRRLVREALRSDQPTYSDRLVGAVFSTVALTLEERQDALDEAMGEIEESRLRLRRAREGGASPLGEAILGYYLKVVEAELELLEMVRVMEEPGPVPGDRG